MRESLLIQMPRDPADNARWVILGESGRVIGFPQAGSLEQAAHKAGGRSVVVLVPGEDILFARARIPTQKRQRLLRAVPYALEDQIADDVDSLHFALGERTEDGAQRVAVVSRARMDEWQAQIHAAALTADAVIPDSLLVPARDSGWNVVLDRERALVRCGDMDPFVIERDGLGVALQAAANETEVPPEYIGVYDCDGGGQAANADFASIETREKPCEDGALLQLVRNYVPSRVINLLQGDYSQTERMAQFWRPWRFTAALVLVGAALVLVTNAVEYYRLKQRSAELDDRIVQVYREAFPDAVRIVNPRLQMEQRLKELRGGAGADAAGFMPLLAGAGAVIRAVPGVQIDGISYRNGELELELLVVNLQTLDTLKQRLVAGGELAVDIRSAVAGTDQKVQSRVRITGVRS